MSYSKTTWKTGDTITAQLLNHVEDGIAANDAAIEAIPAGLQLYGPYYVQPDHDVSVAAGATANASLDKPYDYNTYEALDFPDNPCNCFLAGYTLGGYVVPIAMSAPVYNAGDSEWNGAAVVLSNKGGASETLESGNLTVIFYATAEFPAKQE